MKYIIKKCPLKTINILSVLNIVRGTQNCYLPLCSCCELLNV